MRVLFALGLLALLTGCSGDPRAWGITGPGNAPAPIDPALPLPDAPAVPGVSTSGQSYGPSNNGPTTGSTGFWGYN